MTEERYNPFTGRRIVVGLADPTPAGAEMGVEPPRVGEPCGRPQVGEVSPDGWWAKCSRHGVVDSIDVARR